MKEQPIIMSSDSVRAILDGRKTQTRRAIKPQPKIISTHDGSMNLLQITGKAPWFNGDPNHTCPYGLVGDRLWVRETWRVFGIYPGEPIEIQFKSDMKHASVNEDATEDWEIKIWDQSVEELKKYGCPCESGEKYDISDFPGFKWRPSIFMPRWASRILLEITNVRVERLQDITEADVYAEGIDPDNWDYLGRSKSEAWRQEALEHIKNGNIIGAFKCLWNSINEKRGYPWSSNPWVWVIEFKVLEPSHAK